ncbi:hypothetical protein D3C75_618870 [compost metagenome]
MLFTGHHWNELQLAGEFGQVIALLQPGDLIHISQLFRFAHRVHQLDVVETLPSLEVLQDRHERRNASTGRQQPQVAATDEAVEGKEAEGLAVDQQGIACPQPAQLAGELPTWHHDGEEVEVLVMRRADHGIGAPHHAAIGLGHAQAGKLAGTEAEPRIARNPQAEEVRRERLNIEQGLAGELFGASGHIGLQV